MTLKMTIAELQEFLETVFPQMAHIFTIESLSAGEITVRLKVDDSHLRPGGTVSGPTIFALADVSIYLATLSLIGPKALAVTSNCSIDFMRKPAAGDLTAKARILKLGRSLSFGDVLIYGQGEEQPVARASLTYALP